MAWNFFQAIFFAGSKWQVEEIINTKAIALLRAFRAKNALFRQIIIGGQGKAMLVSVDRNPVCPSRQAINIKGYGVTKRH